MKEGEAAELPAPIPIERGRRRKGAKRGRERWDIDMVAYHLKTQPVPIQDETLGDGSRLLVGMSRPPVTAIELYPAAAVARVQCRNLSIEITGVGAPVIPKEDLPADEESIVLVNRGTDNDLRVGLTAEGEVSLFTAPHQALELLRALPAVEPSVDPAEEVDAGIQPSPEEPPVSEAKQERVTVNGRVGADPSFRTTPKGVLVARFPVAEHVGEETVWHQILLFGLRAEKAREALKKGQEVEVIGYVHERPARTDDSKLVKEIYAAIVKTDRPPR